MSWSSLSAFWHVCCPLAKAASWREGCHPPSQTLQDPLIYLVQHRPDRNTTCQNLDRGASTLATQPTETEEGRPAPYKLKTLTWNSIPKSPLSLGLFPAATIAQTLLARCESQSPLRTVPMVAGFGGTKSLVWRHLVLSSSSIQLTRCLRKTYYFPCPQEHHGRSNTSSQLFKELIWRTPRPGFFSFHPRVNVNGPRTGHLGHCYQQWEEVDWLCQS